MGSQPTGSVESYNLLFSAHFHLQGPYVLFQVLTALFFQFDGDFFMVHDAKQDRKSMIEYRAHSSSTSLRPSACT